MTAGDEEGAQSAPEELLLIERACDVGALAARAARAEAVAVDVEANGLFAYRPRLCTVQIAFREGDLNVVAIIDALQAPARPLAPMLGPEGPPKVLHDLTFDARLLDEAGAPLGNARDTSVVARFLGCTATGLAALLAAELGVRHGKELQQHDWAQRPIGHAELRYLAEDVRHLLALEARLTARAAALGIEDEIAAECAYKLASALRPPRDGRPGYARIKGVAALDPLGRAILRRLTLAREAAAEAADVPPFKVAGNEVLLDLARRRPATLDALREVSGATAGRAARSATAWLRAVEEGLRDGDVPDDDRILFAPPRPDRAALTRRRLLETQITVWRRFEAKERGLDEQVILPGHCAQDLLDLVLGEGATLAGAGAAPSPQTLREAIGRIAGFGTRRFERYGDALSALATDDTLEGPDHDPAPAPAGRHRERRVR